MSGKGAVRASPAATDSCSAKRSAEHERPHNEARAVIRELAEAIRFLTRLPLGRSDTNPRALGRSLWAFPIVAIFVGGLLAGLYLAARLGLPDAPARGITIVFGFWLYQFLHLDGLADSLDGFYGADSKEECLRIMRDPHIGAAGMTGLLAALFLKGLCILSAPAETVARLFVLAPLAGHAAMILHMKATPYAREEGLGRCFARHGTFPSAGVGLAFALLGAFIAARGIGMVSLGAILPALAAFTVYCRSRIGGHTGDTTGASSELGEISALLGFLAFERASR